MITHGDGSSVVRADRVDKAMTPGHRAECEARLKLITQTS